MSDVTFTPAKFSATTILVVLNTLAAKQAMAERLGALVQSFEVPKSRAPEVAEWLESRNLSYN